MKLPISILIFILLASHAFAQRSGRNADGTLKQEQKKETLSAAALCGKDWKWIEGIEGNQSYEPAVFSFRYDTNGTFMFNQRVQKNFWKMEGKYLYHSVAGFDGAKKNPYGVFAGKFEITKLTDSVLILTKVNGRKNNPATVLRLVRDDDEPENSGYISYAKEIQNRINYKVGEWEVDTEPGAIVHRRKINGNVYAKKMFRQGGTAYYRDGIEVARTDFYKETGLE